MRTISGYILTTVLGWKIRGDFPDIKKGIVIYAPHTSYLDALYGKLYCNELNINHKFLSKKEFFYFPLDIGMKLFGSIPVRNVKNKNAIYQVIEMLNNSKELLVLISPEGTLAKVTRWNKGFYYMATKAHVPIIVGYIDYKKKEIGVKGVIENHDDINIIMQEINLLYKDVYGKYPERFSLDSKD